MELAQEKQLGAAAFLLLAAQELALPDTQTLGLSVTNLAVRSPAGRLWGTLPPEGMTAVVSTTYAEARTNLRPPFAHPTLAPNLSPN